MKFVKFFTPATFDREGFTEMLKLKMNVRAKAVDDGVILDRDAFNATPAKFMPVWAWNCRKDINNPLRVRLAEPAEWPELNPRSRYLLVSVYETKQALAVEKADGFDYICRQADMVRDALLNTEGFLSAVVLDSEDLTFLYTAN